MITIKKINKLKLRLISISVFAFLTFGVILYFAYWNMQTFEESQKDVENTKNAISILENIGFNNRKLESDVRYYALAISLIPPIAKTRPDIYAKAVDKDLNVIPSNIEKLEKLSINEENLIKVRELKLLLNSRLDHLSKLAVIFETQNKTQIRQLLIENQGVEYTKQIEDKLEEIKYDENQLLNKKTNERKQSISRTQQIFFIIGLVNFLFIIISHWLTKKSIDQQEETLTLIKESEKQLFKFLDALPMGIMIINNLGKNYYANTLAFQLLGTDVMDNIESEKLSIVYQIYKADSDELYPTEELPAVKALNGVASVSDKIDIINVKSNERIPIEVRATPIYDEKGSVTHSITAFYDITDRKKNENLVIAHNKLLETSNQELEQFAYIASHDLQEPLRMISSYCALLDRRYKDKLGEDGLEMLNFAIDGADRMKKLIQSLLTYSRASREYKFDDVNLNNVCDIVKEQLSSLIKESHGDITFDNLPIVTGDSVLLTQLFQNLIGNSIKFHKKNENPKVHVSVERKDENWVFTVKDYGIGIDPKFNNKLFIIFQRLHSREEYEGTGIGLALCKKIIEKHKGTIWVKSELGKGASFLFTIPVSGEIKNV